MSTQRQKPIDFAADGLCLASLSIPTAESGLNRELSVLEEKSCYLVLPAPMNGVGDILIRVGEFIV